MYYLVLFCSFLIGYGFRVTADDITSQLSSLNQRSIWQYDVYFDTSHTAIQGCESVTKTVNEQREQILMLGRLIDKNVLNKSDADMAFEFARLYSKVVDLQTKNSEYESKMGVCKNDVFHYKTNIEEKTKQITDEKVNCDKRITKNEELYNKNIALNRQQTETCNNKLEEKSQAYEAKDKNLKEEQRSHSELKRIHTKLKNCANKGKCVKTSGQKCYYFSSVKTNWFKANVHCKAMGMQLAVITSREENDAIKEQMKSNNNMDGHWIGLSDLNHVNRWTWVDGSSSGYRDWGPGEPNNKDEAEDCAEIRIGTNALLVWNDYKCRLNIHFICEQNSDCLNN